MPEEQLQRMILDQVKTISGQVDKIPSILARLEVIAETQRRLEEKDKEQTNVINGLRLDQSQLVGAIAAVSSTTSEVKATVGNIASRIGVLEAQIRSTMDAQLAQGRLLNKLENSHDKFVEKDDLSKLIEDHDDVKKLREEAEENRPWINGFKAFMKVLLGLLMVAAATGLLWLLGKALTGGL